MRWRTTRRVSAGCGISATLRQAGAVGGGLATLNIPTALRLASKLATLTAAPLCGRGGQRTLQGSASIPSPPHLIIPYPNHPQTGSGIAAPSRAASRRRARSAFASVRPAPPPSPGRRHRRAAPPRSPRRAGNRIRETSSDRLGAREPALAGHRAARRQRAGPALVAQRAHHIGEKGGRHGRTILSNIDLIS